MLRRASACGDLRRCVGMAKMWTTTGLAGHGACRCPHFGQAHGACPDQYVDHISSSSCVCIIVCVFVFQKSCLAKCAYTNMRICLAHVCACAFVGAIAHACACASGAPPHPCGPQGWGRGRQRLMHTAFHGHNMGKLDLSTTPPNLMFVVWVVLKSSLSRLWGLPLRP